MKSFEITYFHGPFAEYIVRDDVVKNIAASGMTLVPLHYDVKTNLAALPLLRRYGLKALVGDSRIYGVYGGNRIEDADQTVREIVSAYADFDDVIIGWDLVDEPNSSRFAVLGALVAAFRKYSPDKETMINLFPNYASPEQLGNPTYADHLEDFVRKVNPHCLSYDHYHFLGREGRNRLELGEVDERERLIRLSAEQTADRGGFFDNIEVVREKALKFGLDAMLIVLLTEHGPYRNLTYGELLWEANMCLAYGMKRLSFFTYWEPSHDDFWQWTNAMADTEGNLTQHYYDVQKIAASLKGVGECLFDKTCRAVFHIGEPEPGARAFAPYGGIDAIEGEDGVIGFFDDGVLYLVNRSYRGANRFTLHGASLERWDNGVWTPCGGEFSLEAGEGVLLRRI